MPPVSEKDLFRELPGTNCKECGAQSCQAFAEDVIFGRKEIAKCPHLGEEPLQRLLAQNPSAGKEILREFPGTNCGKCGAPTCQAFVLKLLRGRSDLNECPLLPLSTSERLAETHSLSNDPWG
jgi:ArsR family metal-binding transcriptional regulator